MNFWKNLKTPFSVLAPMDGVTDYPFRELIAKIGKPDVIFTEFTNVEALNSKGFDKTIIRLKFSKNQRPIVAQIWGLKPENFKKSSELIHSLGFDGIDINMGCPDKTVLKNGTGSALINNQNLAKEIVIATKEGAKGLPVSVKTRLGVKKIVTEEWVSYLLKIGISALTLHGRTAQEMSKVPVHWEEIRKAIKIRNMLSPETIFIANGDINTTEEGISLANRLGFEGYMIGRGIFNTPWLFENNYSRTNQSSKKITINTHNFLAKHTLRENLILLLAHIKLFEDGYKGLGHYESLKKYFKIYLKGFENSSEIKSLLMETKNTQQAINTIDNFISKLDS